MDNAGRGQQSASGGGGGFRDIFGSASLAEAAARRADEGPEPGTDLEYQVNVPFWTAIRGGVMRLNITRQDVCAQLPWHRAHSKLPANVRSAAAPARSRRPADA